MKTYFLGLLLVFFMPYSFIAVALSENNEKEVVELPELESDRKSDTALMLKIAAFLRKKPRFGGRHSYGSLLWCGGAVVSGACAGISLDKKRRTIVDLIEHK